MTIISDSCNEALIKEYAKFEATLPIQIIDDESKLLTTFNGNKVDPVHRWFTFKEGFSSRLIAWLLRKTKIDPNAPLSILDPFCGVGTSILSAQLYDSIKLDKVVGFEINPYIAWVAQTKLKWPLYDRNRIRRLIPVLVDSIKTSPLGQYAVPCLSTLHNTRVFDTKTLESLLHARAIIMSSVDNIERDFFLLGWSAIIESMSNLRKDGRALRFVKQKPHSPIHINLEVQWINMLQDLEIVQAGSSKQGLVSQISTVYLGDGRQLVPLIKDSPQFDLVVYSPPYLNNIDYSEVYKLELWLNGHVSTREEFVNLRKRTFRSHPSVSFPKPIGLPPLRHNGSANIILWRLLNALPEDANHNWRMKLFKAYTEDMYLSLLNQYTVTKNGGYVVCVVGNSVHGSSDMKFCIATDLLIAALAEEIGFSIENLVITRQFTRRNYSSPYNREAILIFRR